MEPEKDEKPVEGPSRQGRAWGKVILLGEHAVVYGVPALAVGIDRGATVSVRASTARGGEERGSRLTVPLWGLEVWSEGDDRELARAFGALLQETREAQRFSGRSPVGRVEVEASTDLPPGGGLGCSAALGVAVARALDPAAKTTEIVRRAMAWERVFHGNPSGVDAAVSAAGGCVYFERGKGMESVRVGGGLTLCIGHTGVPSSTKTMVESVARFRERRPDLVAQSFEGIRSLVQNAKLAIEAGDRFALGRLMDLNQILLAGLYVSSQEIETLCSLARESGALGAKLTGAGGGGCVVALVPGPSVADAVLKAWANQGFHGFVTRVAAGEAAFTLGEATL